MAHYAFIDENNIVVDVITGVDETELINGLTPEEFYAQLRGLRCLRTSYNNRIRANYAGIGYFYDEQNDVFISPKPIPTATLNPITYKWEYPEEIENQLT